MGELHLPSSDLPVPIGTVLAGKYRVDKVLGVGGMGIVAVGRHLKLDQKVAIKMLRPASMHDPEIVRRFDREARAAAKIKSEHVARVIDVEMDGGIPFIVMEYLDGADLSKIGKERGKLPSEEVIHYILQACEALVEAHHHGIVHRDLKPANLFVTKRADGSRLLKVLDFGVSKLKHSKLDAIDDLTKSEVLIGSPHFMSPEQLRAPKDVDGRADIWALGAILFKMLTGKLPFNGLTTAEICAMVLTRDAPRISTLIPDVHPDLDAVVARCLEPNVDKRFQTVAELAKALESLASEEMRSSVERIQRVQATPRTHSSFPPPGSLIPNTDDQPTATPTPTNQKVLTGSVRGGLAAAPAPAVPDGSVSVHVTFGDSTVAPIRNARRRTRFTFGVASVVGVLALIGLAAALRAKSAPPTSTSSPVTGVVQQQSSSNEAPQAISLGRNEIPSPPPSSSSSFPATTTSSSSSVSAATSASGTRPIAAKANHVQHTQIAPPKQPAVTTPPIADTPKPPDPTTPPLSEYGGRK